MARPSKYTFGRVKRLLRYLRSGGGKGAACGYAGIGTSTLADWEAEKAGLSEAIKRAMYRGERRLVDGVLRVALNPIHNQQLTASMFLLNAVHGYKQRTEVEATGTVKHEHSHEVREAHKILNRFKPGAGRAVIRTLEQFQPDPN